MFRDSERVVSFVLFAGVGRVFAELGVRSLRGRFLDLSNHGRDGRETSEEDRDWVAVREVVDHRCDAFRQRALYATILCDAFSFNAKTNRLLVCAITSCGRWNFGLDTVTSTYQGLLPINDFDALRDSDYLSDCVFAHGVSRTERMEGN